MISIIIPVFNSEKTLRQCLDSVINQTYKDLEIICVDNLSTDNSVEILKEYARKDPRIIIADNDKDIRLGEARNLGMNYVKDDYIHFLDSDDWLELDAYEKLSEKLDDKPDVVNFLWNNIDVSRNTIRSEKFLYKLVDGNFSQNNEIINNLGISVWHRIYRYEFLKRNNLEFNSYPCLEDVEFIYKVFISAKNVKFLDECLINYRINNPKSLAGKIYTNSKYIIDTYNTIYEFSKNLDNKSRDVVLAHLLNSVLYKVTGSFVMGKMSFEDLKSFVETIDYSVFQNDKRTYKWYGFYKEIVNSPQVMIKLKYRMKLFLRNNFYGLYEALKRINN